MSRMRASGLHPHLALALMRMFLLCVICPGRGFFFTGVQQKVVQRLLSDFGRPRRPKTVPLASDDVAQLHERHAGELKRLGFSAEASFQGWSPEFAKPLL